MDILQHFEFFLRRQRQVLSRKSQFLYNIYNGMLFVCVIRAPNPKCLLVKKQISSLPRPKETKRTFYLLVHGSNYSGGYLAFSPSAENSIPGTDLLTKHLQPSDGQRFVRHQTNEMLLGTSLTFTKVRYSSNYFTLTI